MNQVALLSLVISIRSLHLYYHYCHNLTYGPTFLADHNTFADFYTELAGQYDQVSEYAVALLGNSKFDVENINKAIAMRLDGMAVNKLSPGEMFKQALKLEKDLVEDLEALDKKSSIGMKNLLGDLAQTSDVRTYKIQQRLK